MGQQFYKVPRLTDGQISLCLSELGQAFGSFHVNIQVATHGLGVVEFPGQNNDLWRQIISLKGELIDHFSGTLQGVNIYYYRGGSGGNAHDKSPSLDEIAIDPQGLDPTRVNIAAKFVELFRPIKFPAHSSADKLFNEQRAIQESTFVRLQHQLEQVFQQTIDIRGELDASVKQKEQELDREYKEKVSLAEAELEKQRTELQNEKIDLDARRKLIDDSDNTYARRQIRERMLQDVSDRVQNFGVSDTTLKARKPVATSIISLIVFLGAIFLWTAFDLARVKSDQSSAIEALVLSQKVSTQKSPLPVAGASSGTARAVEEGVASIDKASESITNISREMIALWVRLSLVTLGLVATIIFYTRWQNGWADQFSQTEQALKQFHLDINRANWVVETCLEWRKENQSDIPQNLVDSLTKGLFSEREPATQVLHPADELASALIGSSSKLSLNVGGNTIEIDKPGKNLKPTGKGPNA